jgi:hypothetical protein
MSFKVLTETDAINGTSMMGYVNITRAQLENVFGLPNEYEAFEGDGKVTTEWMLLLNGEHVVTIYDWKRYENGAPGLAEKYDWHVGGHSESVVDLLFAELEANGMKRVEVDSVGGVFCEA